MAYQIFLLALLLGIYAANRTVSALGTSRTRLPILIGLALMAIAGSVVSAFGAPDLGLEAECNWLLGLWSGAIAAVFSAAALGWNPTRAESE